MQGRAGIIIGQTGQYFVVAAYREGMYASVCAEAAESLGNLLNAFLAGHFHLGI